MAEKPEIVRQPPPTDADRELVDRLAKEFLGEKATGAFIGAMARGVRGDEPHYGHAIVIVDPEAGDRLVADEDYPDRISSLATAIGNRVQVAGNVTLDVTSQYLEVSDSAYLLDKGRHPSGS